MIGMKKRESWFKRDVVLLQRLEEENEKLKLYFDQINGKILYNDKLTIYDKKSYYQYIKKEIKRLRDKLNKYRRDQRTIHKNIWYHMKPLSVEERLGRLMSRKNK